MRPLIQYDLDEPLTGHSTPLAGARPNTREPPTKKRKGNPHDPSKPSSGPAQKVPIQHWDDPGSAAVGVVYDEEDSANSAPITAGSFTTSQADDAEEDEYVEDTENRNEGVDVEEEEEEEESRPLTHEEIWDDAALIDAWNSAEAEYEAYHGTSKPWKTEPVKRSSLWYNKPYTARAPEPSPKPRSTHVQTQAQEGAELEPDTAPIDFDTYVPTHDPSLAIPSSKGLSSATSAPFFVSPPSTMTVSCDEAFNNALNAMYWTGYWTAVYHYQCQSGKSNNGTAETTEDDGIEADEDEDEELVPAQR